MSAGAGAGSIWRELKHRRVYHTAATYVAATFMIWQAADIAFPALGLPPSLLRFVVVAALLGFPFAVGLSWAFQVVPHRAVGGEASPARLRALRPVLVTATIATVLGTALWILLPRGALALGEGAAILVASVRNQTGDTLFDGALDGALELSLAQSPQVNLLAGARIRQGLQEMRRSPDEPLDDAGAVELAMRLGARAVVLPTLRRVGSRYLLEARLVDPATEEVVITRTETAPDAEGVLDALDRLARQLRRDLGETLRSMVRTPIHLDRATTSSLAALRAWSEGNRQRTAGHDQEAGLLFRRAVELDSTFALAQAALGQWYYWNQNDPVRGDSAFERALAEIDGVTERERLIILGRTAQWRGDLEGAIAHYRTLTQLMPQDLVGWGSLGYASMRLGRDEEAIRAYERVLALDSLDANAWTNLATLRYGTGELEAAVALYERAFALQPDLKDNPVINEEFGHDLVLLGRFEEAEALYAGLLAGANRARGLRSLALMRAYTGRFGEAADLLREAVVLHGSAGARLSEVRDRAFLAGAHARLGREADALREIRAGVDLALGGPVPPFLLDVAGTLAARNGLTAQARLLADSAVARSNGSKAHRLAIEHLRGEIALAEGDPAAAIEHLEAAGALAAAGEGLSVRLLVSTARARSALGERESVLALLERATRAKGSETSRENQEDWILSHYWLGVLHEEMGHLREARIGYERFLELWGGGDPAIGEARDAERRLARLAAGA